MDYTKELLLDVNAVDNYKFVQAKQGDRVLRVLNISLLKDGSSYSPDAAHAWFRCQKPDGHAVIITDTDASHPITKTGDKYSVPLNEQCLVVAGRALCDLALLDASNNVLSTVTFVLDIIPMPDVTDQIVSSDSFQRLLDAIEAAETFRDIVAFRYSGGNLQYTTDGSTWVTICAGSDLVDAITNAQIDALFMN